MDQHIHGPKCGCHEYLNNEIADDLYGYIDLGLVDCLNEAHNNIKKIILPQDQMLQKKIYVQSDQDSEIIVIIPFNETVRIKSINVIAYDEGSAPNQMKAYKDVSNVDFSIIEAQPLEQFVLSPNLDGLYPCAVKVNKFENINQLVLHIKSTIYDPIRIAYIGIKGLTTGMKKQLVQTTYELIPFAKEVDPTKKVEMDIF